MLTAVINGVAKICGDADTADAWTRVFVPEILLVRTPSFSSFAHHSRRCRRRTVALPPSGGPSRRMRRLQLEILRTLDNQRNRARPGPGVCCPVIK